MPEPAGGACAEEILYKSATAGLSLLTIQYKPSTHTSNMNKARLESHAMSGPLVDPIHGILLGLMMSELKMPFIKQQHSNAGAK